MSVHNGTVTYDPILHPQSLFHPEAKFIDSTQPIDFGICSAGTAPGAEGEHIFLKDGDTCVVEIDGLGKLTNTVRAEGGSPSKRAKL